MFLQRQQNRRFTIILSVVFLLHVLMLFIPVARQVAQELELVNTVRIQLTRPPPVEEAISVRPEPLVEPRSAVPPMIVPRYPVELAETPAAPPVPVTPKDAQKDPDQPGISGWILSRQFDYERTEPLFGWAEPEAEDQPDYFVRSRSSLEDVLNQPSLQLPFPDDRIYLVDSYAPGIGGSIDRFFDEVTVPFGWTTKGNTRVQCAWVLIIAGCNWGHISLFQQKAQRRKLSAQENY